MRNKLVLLVSLFFVFFCSVQICAQVGINTVTPNVLTELDVRNIVSEADTIPKGVLIPRMSSALRDKIEVSDDVDNNSLLIYNTTENCYNFYSTTDAEWKSLCGGSGRSTFTVDCSNVKVYGNYETATNLTSSNYITLVITVTKQGSYNITASPETDDGYYFATSGEFLVAGTYMLNIPGYGSPITATAAGGLGDKIDIKNYSTTLCDDLYIKIQDSSIKPNYSVGCTSVTVNGTYITGEALTTNNNLQVTITAAADAAGADYSISTNTVNGYSFSASGTLVSGTQVVILYGTGTPLKGQSDTFTISTNSTVSGGATCEKTIKVATRKITILGIADGYWYNEADPSSLLYMAMQNPAYFGPTQNAIYPVNGFTFVESLSSAAGGKVSSLIDTNKPDIIVIQYNFGLYVTAGDITALINFVNNGGVLIYGSDGDNSSDLRNQNALKIIQGIFDNNTSIAVTGYETATTEYDTKKLQPTATLITNGPFLNLGGLYIARDAYNNFDVSLTGFPFSEASIIAYGSNTNDGKGIFSFVHKTKGFLFLGDGGTYACALNNDDQYNWPAKFTVSGNYATAVPNTLGTPTTYNSFFFLNSMAWAIDYVQQNKQ